MSLQSQCMFRTKNQLCRRVATSLGWGQEGGCAVGQRGVSRYTRHHRGEPSPTSSLLSQSTLPAGAPAPVRPRRPAVPPLLDCQTGLWLARSLQLTQPRPPGHRFSLLTSWPPSRLLLCFVFCFQIFLSYTDVGSSFVFGEAMVRGVFAFQVSSTLGPRGL